MEDSWAVQWLLSLTTLSWIPPPERRVEVYAQGRCYETDKISNDTSPKSQNHSISRTSVQQKEILDIRFALATFRGFARSNYVAEKPRFNDSVIWQLWEGSIEYCFKCSEMEACDIRVGDQNIGWGSESRKHRSGDVRDEMESTMYGFFA